MKLECDKSLAPSSNTSSVGSSSSQNRLLVTAMGLERFGIRSSANPTPSVEAMKSPIWMEENVPVRPV